MLKRTLWLAGAVLLLMAAVGCQPATTATVAGGPSPSATAIPAKPTGTALARTTATAPATPTSAAPAKPTSTTAGPAPTPTPAWQIPQISDEDWVKGGADARLVVVEYSDLQ